MGKPQAIKPAVIKVPEWCLEAYAEMPTISEIEAAAANLLADPALSIENAALALIARDKEGLRHFTDDVVGFLATRQPEVIKRILNECGTLYDDVKAALTEKLKGKSNAVTE